MTFKVKDMLFGKIAILLCLCLILNNTFIFKSYADESIAAQNPLFIPINTFVTAALIGSGMIAKNSQQALDAGGQLVNNIISQIKSSEVAKSEANPDYDSPYRVINGGKSEKPNNDNKNGKWVAAAAGALATHEIYASKDAIKDNLSKSTDLIETLTIDGKKKEIMKNGFKALIPKGTKLLNLSLKENILTIDFSEEFNNVKEEYEEKMIEALTYTLTSIEGIDKIEILINGKKLTKLPNSKKELPEYLDKNYGINKVYELTSLNDIYSYTVYYVNTFNNEQYYVPVTKYINNENQDKVKIIIDELATSLTYETNLMSYLDTNVKLLDYEIIDDKIKLNFNNSILSDITSNTILEEVLYTISLSLFDELNVNEVIFQVNEKEISTFSQKMLD